MIGQTLGSFQVLAKLGEGGMGEVYLALDARLERRVAPNVRFDRLRGAGKFTTSPDGTVVYSEAPFPTTRLEWFDRSGRSRGPIGEPNHYTGLTLSPDGTRVAAGVDARRARPTSGPSIPVVVLGRRSTRTSRCRWRRGHPTARAHGRR